MYIISIFQWQNKTYVKCTCKPFLDDHIPSFKPVSTKIHFWSKSCGIALTFVNIFSFVCNRSDDLCEVRVCMESDLHGVCETSDVRSWCMKVLSDLSSIAYCS